MTDQYLQEAHDRAVRVITGAYDEPSAKVSESDRKRLRGATYNVPSIGVSRALSNLSDGLTVQDVALGYLEIGEAYGDALREVDALRQELRSLKAERDTVRAYFGVATDASA